MLDRKDTSKYPCILGADTVKQKKKQEKKSAKNCLEEQESYERSNSVAVNLKQQIIS